MSRMDDYRERNPEVRIDAPNASNSYWSAHLGGKILCVREDPEKLLDDLEWLEQQP